MTYDYKRNGTTTLFAALDILQGRVVGQCFERHRHQEFLRFLRRLDGEFPAPTALHLVLDNYGTHKHPKVKAWLERHPRFVPHFIPTSSSWLNLVERWFGELTSKRIRRGSFVSVPDLKRAIDEFSKPGTSSRSRSYGQRRSSRSTENCRDAGRPSSAYNQAAPCHAAEKLKKFCPVNSWTLH